MNKILSRYYYILLQQRQSIN